MGVRLAASEILFRAQKLEEILSSCRLCPHRCSIDRWHEGRGRCRVGPRARVASFCPHFGEEEPLVGTRGSGTVFFSGCNLSCVFCQNHSISQGDEGEEVSAEDLAGIFLEIAERGCHNLNLVTPTHQAPVIVRALWIAREAGFELPVVWNCGGYEEVGVLRLLDGIVDIYMPDVKYGDEGAALRYSGAPGYVANMEGVLSEMHRQVGDLAIEGGIARRGLLVRHLVLPTDLAASRRALEQVATALGTKTYLNVMGQYRPSYLAGRYPKLARPVTRAEVAAAVAWARELGFTRGLPSFENAH